MINLHLAETLESEKCNIVPLLTTRNQENMKDKQKPNERQITFPPKHLSSPHFRLPSPLRHHRINYSSTKTLSQIKQIVYRAHPRRAKQPTTQLWE